MFLGLSTITFDELGIKAQVSRKDQSAFILSADHCQAIGVLERQSEGHIYWAGIAGNRLPVEVLNTVSTMI